MPLASLTGHDAGIEPFLSRPFALPPVVRVGGRQAIYRAGDPVDTVFEVVEGAVMLSSSLGDGRRQIVEIARAGAVIGFGAGAAQALDAESLVASALRPISRAALAGDRALEARVAAAALARHAMLEDHVLLLGRKAAVERVACFLLMLADPAKGRIELYGLTRQEIGDYLGLTIETVSRSISKLKAEGIIALDRFGALRVSDPEALRALAGRVVHTPI